MRGTELACLEDVAFRYPGAEAPVLRRVRLSVRGGEVVGLIGANASGKTTVLKLLCGLLRPEAGCIRVAGRPLQQAKPLFRHVGMVFQDADDQVVRLVVEEDVALGPENLELPEAEIAARVARSLEWVEAGPLRCRFVTDLSGGEKQRVALAGVLAMGCPLVLLDEPIASLDGVAAQRLRLTLRHLAGDLGMGILVVTHDLEWAGAVCDWLLVLHRAETEPPLRPAHLFQRPVAWFTERRLRVPVLCQVALDLAHRGLLNGTNPREFTVGALGETLGQQRREARGDRVSRWKA